MDTPEGTPERATRQRHVVETTDVDVVVDKKANGERTSSSSERGSELWRQGTNTVRMAVRVSQTERSEAERVMKASAERQLDAFAAADRIYRATHASARGFGRFDSWLLGSASPVLTPKPPALNSRIVHEQHGLGTVTEVLDDQRRVVAFDNGEVHKYKPSAWGKLKLAGRASRAASPMGEKSLGRAKLGEASRAKLGEVSLLSKVKGRQSRSPQASTTTHHAPPAVGAEHTADEEMGEWTEAGNPHLGARYDDVAEDKGLRVSSLKQHIHQKNCDKDGDGIDDAEQETNTNLLNKGLAVFGLGEHDRNRQRSLEAEEELAAFDADGDGIIGEEEMAEVMQKYVSMMHTRNLLRRALVCVMFIVFIGLGLITAMTITTAIAVKDLSASDEDSGLGVVLTKYSFGSSNTIVSTGTAEEVFEVAANKRTFANLNALEGDVLKRRPRLLIVVFDDGSLIQFPPETIQSFPGSVELCNTAVGVCCHIPSGKKPSLSFIGGVDGVEFRAQIEVKGPASMIAKRDAKLPAIERILLYQNQGQNITKVADEGGDAEADAEADAEGEEAGEEGGTTVVDREEEKKQTMKKLTSATKGFCVVPSNPMSECVASNPAGRTQQGDPHTYRLLLARPPAPDLNALYALCKYLEGDGEVDATCGYDPPDSPLAWRFWNMSEQVNGTGVLDIRVGGDPEGQIAMMQEIICANGSAFTNLPIVKIEKRYTTTSASLIRSPEAETHPIHFELHRSARALLAETPAGEKAMRRRAAELHAEGELALGKEEHRRRMYAWYHRKYGNLEPDQTCYKYATPYTFKGVARQTCASKTGVGRNEKMIYQGCPDKDKPGHRCIDWDLVMNHKSCRKRPDKEGGPITAASSMGDKITCVCELILKGEARPWKDWKDSKLIANFPRNPCVRMGIAPVPDDYNADEEAQFKFKMLAFQALNNKPFCFYRNSGSTGRTRDNEEKYGTAMVAAVGRVEPCFVDYYNNAMGMYQCSSCYGVQPFDSKWAYALGRIMDPKLDYDGEDEEAFRKLTFCGEGVHYFVIDSGLNSRHNDFKKQSGRGRRIGRGYSNFDNFPYRPKPKGDKANCVPGKRTGGADPMRMCDDDYGHGTNVASVAMGKEYGIAPCATVHPVRIGRGKEGAFMAEHVTFIVKEMRRLKKLHKSGKSGPVHGIVLFSQGTLSGSYSGTMEEFLKLLLDEGISVVTSAGNEAADSCRTSPNRKEGKKNFPIIVVGATNMDDSVGYYSNWGSCISVHAPGTSILGADKYKTGGITEYVAHTGTSQACPVVGGLLGLAADALMRAREKVTPMMLVNWIKKTARGGKIKGLVQTNYIPQWALRNIKAHRDNYKLKFWQKLTTAKGTVDTKFRGRNWLAQVPYNMRSKSYNPTSVGIGRRLSTLDDSSDPVEMAELRSERKARRLLRQLDEETPHALTPLDDRLFHEADADLLIKAEHRSRQLEELENETDVWLDNETGVCADIVFDYSGGCPLAGETICGEPRAEAPDGSLILRPYRMATSECAHGCICDDARVGAVSYHSCAVDDHSGDPDECKYSYTGEACNTVFSVTTKDEARKLAGMQLRYVPFPDGTGFYEPTVKLNQRLYRNLAEPDLPELSTFYLGGVEVEHGPAMPLCLAEEEMQKVSIPDSSIEFLGGDFIAINVAANGYVSFGEDALDYKIASEPTAEAHFHHTKGRSFSLMLTDLDPPNVYVAHLEMRLDENRTEPFATAVTYLGAHIAFEEPPVPVSVQAIFEHDSGAITLTFGATSDKLTAIIGPSAGGNGTNATVTRLKDLIGGTLSTGEPVSGCNGTNTTDDGVDYFGDDEELVDDEDAWIDPVDEPASGDEGP